MIEIDLEAAAAAFGAGNKKPAEKGNGTGALENVDLTIAATGMDFPGAMALINGLTFEAMHPELVVAPADTLAPAPNDEGDLPDWLKSDEPVPESTALLPEEPAAQSAETSGPTAEEATAGLQAAEAAGAGTQVLHEGEVVIPPVGESEEEVEERIQDRLVGWLKDVDWKNAARDGALMLGPAIFSGILWETMPQLHQALESFVGGGMIGGFLTEGLLGVLSQAERVHPRFAGLARVAAARRGTGFLIAQMAASAGIGIVGAEGLDRLFQVHAAAQPAVIIGGSGSGEGPDGPTISAPVHGNVDIRDYYHGGSDVNLPQPPEPATSNEATQQAVQAAAQQAAADTASRQVAEALKESQLAAAPVGITGGELSGGTILGNELEFVKQLGVHHVEPVANLLKNFSKVLAQAQPATEIGPTDTAYVINRDVAVWAAGQADKLYGMDPSSMTSWQKALWEIGRGLREANWRDLQAVTEEFVRQAKP